MTRQGIISAALEQCAADCSCAKEDFYRERNIVVESKASAEASRYMTLPHICALLSFGTNIVASCRRDLMPEVEAYINRIDKIHCCFEPPALYELNRILEKADSEIGWMHTVYLPDPERIFSTELSCPFELRVLSQKDFSELYLPEWGNALCSDRKELDILGVGAYDKGRLVGLSGCSADCPEMWQIGIDVLPDYRQKGIASALTNRLAREIFDAGKIPFYASAWSNIRSIKNGLRSGFRPGWVAITSRKK